MNIASSDVTLYMTLLCICFRYSLCSIGILSSPKIKIIMYFGHHFPLTSHIRGHLLSTWMTPLHLNADIPHVGTQNDIYGLRVAQNTIDGLITKYIPHPSNWLLWLFNYVKSYPRPYIYATRGSYVSVGCCKSRMDVYAGCSYSNSRIIRGLSFLIPADMSLWH